MGIALLAGVLIAIIIAWANSADKKEKKQDKYGILTKMQNRRAFIRENAKKEMINIKDKHNCSGCGACAQKCSKQCITLKQDSEGFLYPEVDTENCINCGLCEKVCPVQHPFETREPLQTLAAINKDEKVRLESSSGGIFTLLAESVLDDAESVISLIQEELKPTPEMISNEKIRVIKALPGRIVKKLIRLMGGGFAECQSCKW